MASYTVKDLTATEVSAMHRPVFDNLFQLYLYDHSEHTALGSRDGEVDEQGQFSYAPGLDSYWEEPGRVPLLIQADGCIAGFILLHQWSALDRPLNQAVAKFFVLRKYRLARIGTTTGALRFENPHYGLIWIGIPAKGILLDSKLNRQLANECKNAEQSAIVATAEPEASTT